MLSDVHDAMRNLIYQHGRISPREVDVSFAAPTKDEIQRLTQPTINFFLIGVQEDVELRQANFQSTRVNGRAERRLPPRRIGLRYMVSALASDEADEHRLLWRALVTLMQFPELPADVLSNELRSVDIPVTARTAQPDDSKGTLEIWSALSTDPHPAFIYAVVVPVDLSVVIESPLVLTRTLRVSRGQDGVAEHTDIQIGGIVRDGDGTPVGGVAVEIEGRAVSVLTNAEGAFVLRSVPSGPVRLRVTRPGGAAQIVTTTVPSEMYDIVLS